MFPEVLNQQQFVALRAAYAKACVELGIGPGGDRPRAPSAAYGRLREEARATRCDPRTSRTRMQPPAAGSFFYRG